MIINIDGIDVNYRDEGFGKAIVLLHGWGANIELFDGIFNLLKENYRVVALDMPGFGKTPEPNRVWGVPDYTRFVIKFIEALELEDVIILGHSFGGRVAILMASTDHASKFEEYPRNFRISNLILVDSAGIKPVRTFKYYFKVYTYKAGKKILGNPFVKWLWPDALKNFKKGRGSADYAAASDRMKAILTKTVNLDLTENLPLIKQDTLLIWGSNDTATPLADGQKMEKLIPNSGLAVINGVGHYSFLEGKYTFDKILLSYLNSLN
jgi:pimeloyl-ACP methyl ester carboxylesterase